MAFSEQGWGSLASYVQESWHSSGLLKYSLLLKEASKSSNQNLRFCLCLYICEVLAPWSQGCARMSLKMSWVGKITLFFYSSVSSAVKSFSIWWSCLHKLIPLWSRCYHALTFCPLQNDDVISTSVKCFEFYRKKCYIFQPLLSWWV